MVLGNGLIANCFKQKYSDNDKFLVFASGVSNSNETNEFEFLKEKVLIEENLNKNKDKIFIYFSTISMFNENNKTKYIDHKKNVEDIINKSGNSFFIFRLPQIFGAIGNEKNIINFMTSKIKSQDIFEIWSDSKRCIVDIEDVFKIVNYVLFKEKPNKIYNFFGIEKKSVIDIVNIIENILNKKAVIEIINKQSFFTGENSIVIEEAINSLNIKKENYTESIIKKYIKC